MRDIKFRGKSINTGEWVYGYFKKNRHGDCYIEDEDGLATAVLPETVGQMVCVIDEGDEVYEGDYIHYQGYDDPDLFLVRWDDEDHTLVLTSVINDTWENLSLIDNDCMVAGNIHTRDVLPDCIYVISGDCTFILGDMDIYKTAEEFIEAVYKDDDAMERLEGRRIEPDDVTNCYYVAGWAVPRDEPGSVKCWCIEV